ncbi:hypothetical protein GCM10022225_77220 [Plantactinospora mayteni]|uniref:Uncharacterized protein n=1 Tax=Plantactinospora mayteni TaxID=566021 RepID=A0ABQ4F2L2_9ACTN|nr:hypothetical protein Pma05_77270 [Plantactinospora mayteni]
MTVRLYPYAVSQYDFDPTTVVGRPPHRAYRRAGMLNSPIRAAVGAVGPEDPTEAYRLTGHNTPPNGTPVRASSLGRFGGAECSRHA